MQTSDQIPSKYKMKLQGREHVTFDGLIDEAHRRGGFGGTDTELLQAPNEANDYTAIVRATVTLVDASGQFRCWSGIGDANPKNCNKVIALHIIRMAETRALGRALRVALNIKGCMWEEMGGDVQGEPVEDDGATASDDDAPVTDDALKAIGAEMKRSGYAPDRALNWVNKRFSTQYKGSKDLTIKQARALYAHLAEQPDAAA